MLGHRLAVGFAVLILPLALVGGRAASSAPETTAVGGSADSTPPPARAVRELRTLRTARSRTMLLADGTRLAQIYAAPVHYLDANDRWRVADPRLIRRGRSGTYANRADGVRIGLPLDLERGISFAVDEEPLRLRLVGANATAHVEGAEATYADAFPNVDLRYQSQVGALKEELILGSREVPDRFAYKLETPRGSWARTRVDGGIEVVARRNRARLALIPPPFMADANGALATGRAKAGLTLRRVVATTSWSCTYPGGGWMRRIGAIPCVSTRASF